MGFLIFEKTSVLDGTFSSPLYISNMYFYVQWTHNYTDSQTTVFFYFDLYPFLSFGGTGFKPSAHGCLGKCLSLSRVPALVSFSMHARHTEGLDQGNCQNSNLQHTVFLLGTF